MDSYCVEVYSILTNRFVVIDETHTYKGAFGCHTALILRRLKRLCSHGLWSFRKHFHIKFSI